MKNLTKLFLFAALTFIGMSQANAQDKNNPWGVSIGVNAVDTYPVDPSNSEPLRGGLWNEYFNQRDHWNILPSVSTLYVGRYIGAGLSFGVQGSINKIEKFGDAPADDLAYYAVDGVFNYSFRDLLNGEGGWADPFVGVGGGYVFFGDMPSHGTGNLQAGLKIWLSENINLNFASTYKHTFEGNKYVDTRHFQHVVGVGFVFGGKDTDGDGVYDKDDECPETPGLKEFNGCPDTDGDGIKDSEDACPEVAGLPEFNGCPDSDGDGIADNEDKCPNVAGPAATNGCPDADGDGVIDAEDKCPNEAGPASNNGCPFVDTDGDGVADKDDKCPNVAGPASNNGCPEVDAAVLEELNGEAGRILFDTDKATIRKSSLATVDRIAAIVKEYPSAKFEVEGHADSRASNAYNMSLSERRAQSVVDYLISKGANADNLMIHAYGEEKPIAPNTTAAGMQLNRRVKLTLK
ncbi:OmpA family protein [Leeuwenhoekiella sp. MAR_2009_132]|uniref:OmpA family protein n=1 Tax=Leeuwenhoekiella sp. MAR_2009_132 TaxID=1392489 RepID=UPI0004922334|nr:OmpA family protein [Leeuwenhoekiella sp. MAR_2009_132]